MLTRAAAEKHVGNASKDRGPEPAFTIPSPFPRGCHPHSALPVPSLRFAPPAVLMMHCDELSAREEFTYSHMPTLERAGGSLGRRGDRGVERGPDRGERYRPERDSFTVDVRASDLQLAQPEPLKHPCFSYRAWLYSVLIGVRGAKEAHHKAHLFRP